MKSLKVESLRSKVESVKQKEISNIDCVLDDFGDLLAFFVFESILMVFSFVMYGV